MNRPPEILINNGFVTDANGVMTSMVIPDNVVTQNVPSVVTTYAQTINWIPSGTSTLEEFYANKCKNLNVYFNGFSNLTIVSLNAIESISGQKFNNCANLAQINCPELTDIANTVAYVYVFNSLPRVTEINFPKLKSISCSNNASVFGAMNGVTSINLPECETINGNGGAVFNAMTGVITLSLPKIKNIYSNALGVFLGFTSMTIATLGSVGNPVTSLGAYTFKSCTQSGLTITIYTNGGAALAGEPWGATNATIEYEEA